MQALNELRISERLRQNFLNAKSVFVLTGAGVSAESGVPTFRGGGNTSVWKGMPFDVISSARMVARDLPAVWEWFDYRRGLLETLRPNPAHDEIAKWQDRFPEARRQDKQEQTYPLQNRDHNSLRPQPPVRTRPAAAALQITLRRAARDHHSSRKHQIGAGPEKSDIAHDN